MATKLREGFTTGSAATGAALAALHLLRSGSAPDHVDVPLPPFAAQPAPECPGRPVADAEAEQAFSHHAGTGASRHAGQAAQKKTLEHPAPAEHDAQKPGSATQDLRPRGWLRLAVAACAPGPAPELAAFAGFSAGLPPDADKVDAVGSGTARAPLRLAHASIRKDGGDDPDATSGALVTATVIMEGSWQTDSLAPDPGGMAHDSTCPAQEPSADPVPMPLSTGLRITIEGGPGVGRITLPGLPVPVGEAAINPVPRQQIAFALRHAVASAWPPCPPLRVIISVPEGERLARQTFNPRLGIVGGISILGTQGTVRPYSHKAWKATIEQGLAVAAATGCRTIALTTGRRSERLLMERYPHMPQQCFIQVADFAAFSLQAAGAGNFDNLVWGCFFGKLVKLAQGHAYTHARHADLDMAGLARVCEQYGAHCAGQVKNCVTAAHALEMLLQDRAGSDVIRQVAVKAAAVAAKFAGHPVRLHLFHTDGRELLAL